VLKERNPDVRIALVEPKDSPMLTEGRAGGHRIQGIGPNFIPDVLDRSVVDEIFDVEFDDAIEVARALATREGILAGMSAGAAVWAALQIAARPESAGQRIVVVVPDSGERYLSTALYEHVREPEAEKA
jgi:cysteine synthase A